MKKLLFFAACIAAVNTRAAVVEVVNVTSSAVRFTSAGPVESADAMVPPNSSRKWFVPDGGATGTICTYAVDAITGPTVTSLGSLPIDAGRYYVAHYDGAAGFVATDRSYDASYVYGAGGYSKAELVSWVKFGMISQFVVEVAGLCLWVLKYSKRQATMPFGGSND